MAGRETLTVLGYHHLFAMRGLGIFYYYHHLCYSELISLWIKLYMLCTPKNINSQLSKSNLLIIVQWPPVENDVTTRNNTKQGGNVATAADTGYESSKSTCILESDACRRISLQYKKHPIWNSLFTSIDNSRLDASIIQARNAPCV
jgi:hypothetical protein